MVEIFGTDHDLDCVRTIVASLYMYVERWPSLNVVMS